VSGVHHALQGVHFAVNGRDIAAVRSEIECGAVYLATRDEHFRFSRRMNLARENSVGLNPPVLGTTILGEQLDALLSPGVIRGDAKTLADDAIDLGPEQYLVHRELLARAQRCCRLVANLENGGA